MSRRRREIQRRRWVRAVAPALLTALLAACAPSVREPAPTPGTPGSARTEIHPACSNPTDPVRVPDAALYDAMLRATNADWDTPGEVPCNLLARLTTLQARGVSDLSGLEYAVNLSSLQLRDSPVTSLAPLQGLTRLQSVMVNGGRLISLEPVTRMPALVALDISGSFMTDISPLAGVPKLAYLKANDNSISDISALAGLTELAWVDLSGNVISDISALAGTSALETLLLNDNSIRDASPLRALHELTRVEIANNLLTDLEFLAEIQPRSVNLAGNQIRSVRPVARNAYFDGQRRLDLRHNCIDLASDDPFTQDVLARGGSIMLEPQGDDCWMVPAT